MNNNYYVETSKTFKVDDLKAVIALDKLVYPEDLQGVFEEEKARYEKVPESFLFLKHNENIVGYFCAFPITKTLRNRMLKENRLFDNDITPNDMEVFAINNHHSLFIISIVVHPNHRGAPAKLLLDAFYEHVNSLQNNGFLIDDLMAYAVSGKGASTLTRYGLKPLKEVEKGYTMYYGTYSDFKGGKSDVKK